MIYQHFPQSNNRDAKLNDISKEVVDQLTASCAECHITSDIIDKQSFSCFPDSPSHVTYRARLQGTSETDSGSLISLMEKWVSDGATIVVTGLLMKVDTKCSVEISSFNDGECSETPETVPGPTPSPKIMLTLLLDQMLDLLTLQLTLLAIQSVLEPLSVE